MMYIINVLVLIMLSMPLIIVFKRKFEEVIPISLMWIVLILYIFSLFGMLKYGLYIIYFMAFLSLICFIRYIFLNKQKDILVSNIFTPGLLVFIIGAILIFIITNGRMLQSWDEFTHWGLTVKNMCYSDTLGGIKNSTTIATSYPPGISLFEYFFAKLTNPFSETELFRAINIMSLILLLPILKIFSWKNKRILIFSLPIIFITPFIFYADFLSTIYVDAMLGILFLYTLLIYFIDEEFSKYKIICITFGISVLLITKSTGLGFALGALFIFMIDILFYKRKSFLNFFSESKNNKIIIYFSAIFIFLIKISWSVFLKYISEPTVWTNVNAGRTSGVQINIVKTFLKKFLFDSNESLSSNSDFMWIIRIIAITLSIVCFTKTKEEIKRVLTYSSILIFGYLGYALSILYMYLFLFSEYEALTLNSYDRYVNSFGIAVVIFLLFILLKNILESNSRFMGIKVIIVTCLVISFAPLHKIAKEIIFYNSEIELIKEKRDSYLTSGNFSNILDKNNDKIYFICQNSTGYEFWVNRYNSSPILMLDGVPWSLGQPYNEGDIWTKNLTIEDWKKLLTDKKFTFVYLYKIDDQFIRSYSELFENKAKINNDTLYRIENIDGEIKLVKYEDWEINIEK